MNEEERQALNRIIRLYKNGLDMNKTPVVLTEDTRCMGILLNLVDKQQKELDNAMLKIKQILKLKENVEITKGLEMIQELLEEK